MTAHTGLGSLLALGLAARAHSLLEHLCRLFLVPSLAEEHRQIVLQLGRVPVRLGQPAKRHARLRYESMREQLSDEVVDAKKADGGVEDLLVLRPLVGQPAVPPAHGRIAHAAPGAAAATGQGGRPLAHHQRAISAHQGPVLPRHHQVVLILVLGLASA